MSGNAPDGPREGPIRAVLLDAGNTLLFVDPRRVIPVLEDEGAELGEEAFWVAEYAARRNLVEFVREGDRGTEAHVWQKYFLSLFRECGVEPERMERVGERLLEIHRAEHLWTWVDPETPRALEHLATRGVRLGVVSNADGRVESLMEAVGLRHHFEFVVDSEVAGVEKPDPRIFRMAVDRLGLEPSECLYVGDLFPVDVVGARNAGLRAVLVDPFGKMDGDEVDRVRAVKELPAYLERTGGNP